MFFLPYTILVFHRDIKVNMPSGAYVKVKVDLYGLNVYTIALPEDRNKSSGLCGNFDGVKQNDLRIKGTQDLDPANNDEPPLPRQFSESYR